MSEKMIAAMARHERAVQAIAAATSKIGMALNACPVQVELVKAIEQQWNGGSYSSVEALTDNKGRTKTHLWQALNGDGQDRLDDDEVTEHLADDETGCPHCAQAWELVQQRKHARQELGVSRRLIRHYGKQAMAMQDGDACSS